MSLADFMRQLQEQDDGGGIVYSKPPEKPVKVIPPTQPNNVRLLPPEIEQAQPKVIKIKINKQAFAMPNTQVSGQPQATPQQTIIQPAQPMVQQPVQQPIPQPVQPVQAQQPAHPPVQYEQQPAQVVQPAPPPVQQSAELTAEQLFQKSGTEIGLKERWMFLYNEAQKSKKTHILADKMRRGRFMALPDEQVIILPEMDVNKDPDELLKAKWDL